MRRRLMGSIMFLAIALFLFAIAGGLASEQRAGWGWFLIAGMFITGVALNVWSEDVPTPQCPANQKPYMPNYLE
jgi:hypothetical protein